MPLSGGVTAASVTGRLKDAVGGGRVPVRAFAPP